MHASQQSPGLSIQIWSHNYDPEPQGVAPLVGTVARGLTDLGSEVTVVAAHPHYPEPLWGTRLKPYRERRGGIPVYRLPIWPGRESGLQRIRQELSWTALGHLAAPFLPSADVVLAVSPSLPGLSAAMSYSSLHRVPWVLWLQDIVTEGAATTGALAADHPALRLARLFEQRAYDSADHIVVISDSFRSRLLEEGVPAKKISLVRNPMTRTPSSVPFAQRDLSSPPMMLAMGNVGLTQGLEAAVEAFEADPALAELGAELIVAGSGVALESVRERVSTPRVHLPGVVDAETLDGLLQSAQLGLVSQKPGLREFNLPSKLMNYMSFGVPVIASVDSGSEAAGIITESGAGWVTDPARPEQLAATAARLLAEPDALERASEAGTRYAQRHFGPAGVSSSINDVLRRVAGSG